MIDIEGFDFVRILVSESSFDCFSLHRLDPINSELIKILTESSLQCQKYFIFQFEYYLMKKFLLFGEKWWKMVSGGAIAPRLKKKDEKDRMMEELYM